MGVHTPVVSEAAGAIASDLAGGVLGGVVVVVAGASLVEDAVEIVTLEGVEAGIAEVGRWVGPGARAGRVAPAEQTGDSNGHQHRPASVAVHGPTRFPVSVRA
jgi:hypothetical protein